MRTFRLASKSAPTRKLAETPTRFHVENIPNSNYLIIPKVSSERRAYIPLGFESPDIETAAQAVLDTRAAFPDSTLADLYDPLSMPPVLVKAHQNLDRAVDAAYTAAEKTAGRKAPRLTTDAERVAFLFERYQQLTSLLPAAKAKRVQRRSAKGVQ